MSDGHDVIATHDGAEALEQLQGGSGTFELLISDVQMPGVDGIELIEKAVAAAPKMRVILMSGFAGELVFVCFDVASHPEQLRMKNSKPIR